MAGTMGPLLNTDFDSQKKQMSTTFQSALKKDIEGSSPTGKKASKIVRFKEEKEHIEKESYEPLKLFGVAEDDEIEATFGNDM